MTKCLLCSDTTYCDSHRYVTGTQARKLLNISRSTYQRYRKQGKIKPVGPTKRHIRRAEIDALMGGDQ